MQTRLIVMALAISSVAVATDNAPYRPSAPQECPGASASRAARLVAMNLACDRLSPESGPQRRAAIEVFRSRYPGCYEESVISGMSAGLPAIMATESAAAYANPGQDPTTVAIRKQCTQGELPASSTEQAIESNMSGGFCWSFKDAQARASSYSGQPYPFVRSLLMQEGCLIVDEKVPGTPSVASPQHRYFKELVCDREGGNHCTVTYECSDFRFLLQIKLVDNKAFVDAAPSAGADAVN